MRGPVGGALALVAAVQAVLGVLFALNVDWAVALLPFDGRTPLSNLFIGSIFLAAAASTAWCVVEGSERAITGVALDITVIFIPITILTFTLAGTAGDRAPALVAYGAACVAALVVGVALVGWGLRHPWRNPRPAPLPALVAFAIFIVALLLVGGGLVLQVPSILPWPVTPELSTLFGSMFLGAAVYFAYGLFDRRWENAGGQLAGFLAYDVVLVVPFLLRLPTIDPSLLPNLAVYTAVVIGSGILAAWYLVVDRRTRVRLNGARAGDDGAGHRADPGPADAPS